MTETHSRLGTTEQGDVHTHTIHLPAPTAWPFMMALGLTLVSASLVTTAAIGMLGALLAIVAAVGWFREVLPHEKHEDVPVTDEVVTIVPAREKVARIQVDETHRAQLPLQTFPLSSGIVGGIAGGIAMVIPAEIYGIIRFHSIWYVVNLLGGAGVGNWVNPTMEQMTHFNLGAFVTANVIQGATTLLVGLLYGAMLPIWPRHPMLLGGIIAPAAWTGLLHSVIGIVNPFLAEHIDWWSFAAAQVIFGLVAGYVVAKRGKLKRLRQAPLAVRLGVEAPGLMHERDGDEPKR
ncbi:hypothetical protein [Occallatibacter savannae]|uniref:hypothetical protein n=1 Tax=Occallatibacter savannae TaxID=1002691 RepID=UPI000D687027|nr:hypothetical protein [Occallatibacter savannae]